MSAAERDLYAKITGLAVATFTVLNKADHLDAAGLAEAAEFTRQVLAQAGRSSGTPAGFTWASALAELAGGDTGFAVFAADFTAYLASSRVADLQAAAVLRARRIARSLLDEVALTRRAVQLAAGDAADRVTRFGERLAEVAIRGQDAVAVAGAESARLLEDLNGAAEADGPRLGRDVTRQLKEAFGSELRTAAALARSSARAGNAWSRSRSGRPAPGVRGGGTSSSRGWLAPTPGLRRTLRPRLANSAIRRPSCLAWSCW